MKTISKKHYTGERAMFNVDNLELIDCLFDDGESPLKESKNLKLSQCTFGWKYPLWYDENVLVEDSTINEFGRAGIWYSNNVTFRNCKVIGVKNFRRCKGLKLENVDFENAQETIWNCEDVEMSKINVKHGDYIGMNIKHAKIDGLNLQGNYAFDGAEDLVISNSVLETKDAFWNSKNVTVINSKITGEYFGWNSENVTLINCDIESLQGFCYMKNLKMVGCRLHNTTLAFEYSICDVEIDSEIDSVKNPTSGVIKCKGIKELIMDEKVINPKNTKIIINK